MIKGNLVMALDFGREKNAPEVHGVETHLHEGGKWSVVKWGPTYSNTYEVTEFDGAGLKWLEAHQPKEVSP